jgi:hypothetical protein
MNTGHSGSLTTVHSNSPRECISRLETLVMMAGLNLPSKAIKENIASAVNLIIQQSRLTDGSRKVTYVTEVVGMQGDVVTLQDIFLYKQDGLDKKRNVIGKFVPTGFVPKFVEEMEAKGMRVPRELFGGSGGETGRDRHRRQRVSHEQVAWAHFTGCRGFWDFLQLCQAVFGLASLSVVGHPRLHRREARAHVHRDSAE